MPDYPHTPRGRDARLASSCGAGHSDPDLTSPEAAPRCRSARPGRRTSAAAFFGREIDPDDPLLGFAPYVHTHPRRNSITPDRQRIFIAALAATGIVTQAARVVGASLEALYRLRHTKGAEGFSAAWDLALDRGMMRLEDCALERAILGEERPVASGGKVVGTYTRHDTALLVFLLRHRRAERYGHASARDIRPGSPLYEAVRRDIEAAQPSVQELRATIDAKLEGLRGIVMARRAELERQRADQQTDRGEA